MIAPAKATYLLLTSA